MHDSRSPVGDVIVTLGTRNLPALRSFYEHLGWPKVFDEDDFAAFKLRGTVLALFPVEKLAADGREKPEDRQGGIRFTIGLMVDEPHDVDDLVRAVREAGGRITKEPMDGEFFEGRSAYFADPEDNYWEVAWAPPDNPIVAAVRRGA